MTVLLLAGFLLIKLPARILILIEQSTMLKVRGLRLKFSPQVGRESKKISLLPYCLQYWSLTSTNI